jgi:hypothetical protein
LRNNLSCISTLIEGENQRETLDLIKPISKIYLDIRSFLAKRSYQVDMHKFPWFSRNRFEILSISIALFYYRWFNFHNQFNLYLNKYILNSSLIQNYVALISLVTAIIGLAGIII